MVKKLKLGKKTLTITVTKKNRFIEEDFINKIQTDNIQVKANHGIPVFITKGYVGTIPYMKLSDTARIYVNQNVRLGLDYLIYDVF
jgi:chromosome condensin MukBEF complex kleisin-like MukF subunit